MGDYEKALAAENEKAVFRFLVEKKNEYQGLAPYREAEKLKETVTELDRSPDGVRFNEICTKERWKFIDYEKQFCTDHRNRRQAAADEFREMRDTAYRVITTRIEADPEFSALGEEGRPLARNWDEFETVYWQYSGRFDEVQRVISDFTTRYEDLDEANRNRFRECLNR